MPNNSEDSSVTAPAIPCLVSAGLNRPIAQKARTARTSYDVELLFSVSLIVPSSE